jgi:hypothetical protein
VTEPLDPRLARRQPPRKRGGRRLRPLVLRWLVRVVVVVAVFGAGIALGEALHDNPTGGGAQTIVRTLKPLPLPPAPPTATVTVTRP